MADDMSDTGQILSEVGEIKGQLTTLLSLVQQNHDSMNRRVDDLGRSMDRQAEAINRRIEDHQESVNQRFEILEHRIDNSKSKNLKTSGISGATAGGFAVGCIEVIKVLMGIGSGPGG